MKILLKFKHAEAIYCLSKTVTILVPETGCYRCCLYIAPTLYFIKCSRVKRHTI